MKIVKAVLAASVTVMLAGCLSSSTRLPSYWNIESKGADVRLPDAKSGKVTRLSSLMVRSPYDSSRIVVLRADGSLAFDPFNSFADGPRSLLAGPVFDLAREFPQFGTVLPVSSVAKSDQTLAVDVIRLALDGRKEGELWAVVEVRATLLRDRQVISSGFGDARIDAKGGDFSAAFSEAFSSAFRTACRAL